MRTLGGIGLAGISLLPLWFHTPRFLPYDAHKVGLVLLLSNFILLIIASGFGSKFRIVIDQELRGLTLLLSFWNILILTSTTLALSPARAFWGDYVRHTGLLTHLALTTAIIAGSTLKPAHVWRWMWMTGTVIAVYSLLQASEQIAAADPVRVPGTLGVATFNGFWLTISILFSVWSLSRTPGHRGWQGAVSFGILLMLAGLAVTGSRGAVLALLAGSITMILIWAAAYRMSWLTGGILVTIVLCGGAGAMLLNTDWEGTVLTDIPVVNRLDPSLPNIELRVRETMWLNLRDYDHPVLVDVNGERDPYHVLRPVIGYGLESFETVYLPLREQALGTDPPLDRAHNDWLDTWVMLGWGGVLLRAALWLGVLWLTLRRLDLWSWHVGVTITTGVIMGVVLSAGQSWWAVIITFGGILGLWCGLFVQSLRPQTTQRKFDHTALLVLGVVCAFVVDLQFSFITISAGWLLWLVIGFLFHSDEDADTPAGQADDVAFTHTHILAAAWVGLAGAMLIYNLLIIDAAPVAMVIVPTSILLSASIMVPFNWRTLPLPMGLWLCGFLLAEANPSFVLEHTGLLLLVCVCGAALVIFSMHLDRWRVVVLLGITACAGTYWASNTLSDVHLLQSISGRGNPVAMAERAAAYRPWDEYVWYNSARSAFNASPSTASTTTIDAAAGYAERGLQLDPYSYRLAYIAAVIAMDRAALTDDNAAYLEQADAYFAAATRLSPGSDYIWYEWARFAFYIQGDAEAAYPRLLRVREINPRHQGVRSMLEAITPTPSSPPLR